MSYSKLYSYDDFLSFLSKSGYDEAAKKKKNSYDDALKEQLNVLESQKKAINDNSDELARQAYITYLSTSKELPEKLSASGLNGGAADNLYLSLANEYQNNYGKIGKDRLNKLYETDVEMSKAKLSNSAEYSKALSALYDSAVEKFLGIREDEENRNFESYYKDKDLAQKDADRELEKYINDALNAQKNADRELEKYINDALNAQKNADRELEKYKNDSSIAQKEADRKAQSNKDKADRELELAKIAYELGDFTLLKKLGINPSDISSGNQNGSSSSQSGSSSSGGLASGAISAAMGGISDLKKQLDYAVSLAEYGNYSLLCKITGMSEEEAALKFTAKKDSGYTEKQIKDAAKLFMSGDYSNNVLGILKSAYPEYTFSQIWNIWKTVAENDWLMFVGDSYKGPRT
jgi:hypothetical protein